MKTFHSIIIACLLAFSCSEDVSKEINTDLSQEAVQFFQFSEAMWESNYLGNISYQDYFRISSAELPGCPTIIRSSASRIIQLDYSTPLECDQINKTSRSGKIILDFTLSNSSTPVWTLTYEDYLFDGIKIDGFRQFQSVSFNENRETFENISVELKKNLGFQASGTFAHSVSRSSFRPFALSSRGRIEGKNPTGRDFSLVITESKEQLFSCYRDGWELPQTGKESWIVSRGINNSLAYEVLFKASAECNPVVLSTLPDGRSLQLNP